MLKEHGGNKDIFTDSKGMRNELSPEDKKALQDLFNLVLEQTNGGDEYSWSYYGCFDLSIRAAGDGRSRVCEIYLGGSIIDSGCCANIQEAADSIRNRLTHQELESEND
jgi:hypothetical protein